MDRETMLKKLKAGLDPIDISIEKWIDIKIGMDIYKKDFYEFTSDNTTCALCEKYYNHGSLFHNRCTDCPLQLIGERCEYNLLSAWRKACIKEDPQIMIDALFKAKEYMKKHQTDEDVILNDFFQNFAVFMIQTAKF